ncbi:MAG: hypothetical protein HDR71_15835 [Lachnospiraceae bacterium]|nr:hypothetical protein [Lachnospiraceae bacterium]
MKKSWSVKIDENMYQVDLNGRKVKVNGEALKLKNYKKKTGLITEEYEIPVGSKTALLVLKNLSAPQLVIDNKDCATGEDYVPTKLPGWAYVFVVLHCVNFINGAIGCVLAVIGIAATTSISCNRKLNVVLRVILNLAILILLFGLVFGVAYLVAGL